GGAVGPQHRPLQPRGSGRPSPREPDRPHPGRRLRGPPQVGSTALLVLRPSRRIVSTRPAGPATSCLSASSSTPRGSIDVDADSFIGDPVPQPVTLAAGPTQALQRLGSDDGAQA